jgi:putative peptidoglycan lipid II flippase
VTDSEPVALGTGAVSVRRTMLGLTPWNLGVQVLSFVSAVALARVLGASVSTDAYYLGLSIPVLTYGILMQALRSAGIPVLTDAAAGGHAELTEAANQIVSGVVFAAVVLALVTTGIAELALPLIAHGRLLHLTRMTLAELAPYAVFGAVTGILTALLNVRRSFAVAVAVGMFEPLLKTVLTFALGHEIGIQALIIGNLVGGGLATALLWYWVRRGGLDLRLVRRFDGPFVQKTLHLSIPLVASASVLLVNPVVDRTMASSLGAGSVTAFELGLRLFLVPAGLVLGLLIGPVTAAWASRLATGGWESLQSSATRALAASATLLPPFVVLGVVLRRELVTVVFKGGAYTASDMHRSASVFGMILLSLPAQMLIVLLSALFVVHRDTIFPMKVAFGNVVLNIALNFAFRPIFGVAGVALSTSLTYTILTVVYAYAAYKRWGAIYAGRIWPVLARVSLSAAATALAALLAVAALPSPGSRAEALLVIAVVAAIGLVVHAAVATASRDPYALRTASELRRLVARSTAS